MFYFSILRDYILAQGENWRLSTTSMVNKKWIYYDRFMIYSYGIVSLNNNTSTDDVDEMYPFKVYKYLLFQSILHEC